MRSFLFFFLVTAKLFSYTIYPLSYEPIDVVIPCHRKDVYTLEKCVQGIKKNGSHIGRIIVVSQERLTQKAEWFDEKNYPFTKEALLQEIGKRFGERAALENQRIGWIYQQLLKLYASFVIPNISSNILVLDADTIFLRPVSFISLEGDPFFAWGSENHTPYFQHAKKLLPSFYKVYPHYSGVVHHMIFQRPILEDLFSQISSFHGVEPWKAILQCMDINHIKGSSVSEYEIYFNFVFANTKQARLRLLKWKNISSLEGLKKYKKKAYDFVSCHDWSREET